MKRLLFLALPAVALASLVVPVVADPAAPANPYAITADAGPWVICAASYMGEEAVNLSTQLVEKLRNEHRIAAYIFDRGDEERKRDKEAHEKMERDRGLPPGVHLPFRHPRYTPNCAVLVGGYPTMEAATADLARLKAIDVKLTLSNGQPAVDNYIFVKPNESATGADIQRMNVSPLARAIVVRNPAAPSAKAEAPKVDPIWKDLNAAESYSLLKNPKAWTLVVKDYAGASKMVNQGDTKSWLDEIGKLGRKPGEGLNAAGYQAHHLAEFLRDKRIGLDAYVLHTRVNSIVTVGAFDSLDDPELKKTMEHLQKLTFRADSRSPNAAGIRGDPIGLFAHPVPMEVPHL